MEYLERLHNELFVLEMERDRLVSKLEDLEDEIKETLVYIYEEESL